MLLWGLVCGWWGGVWAFVFTFQSLLLISFYRRMNEINTTEAFSTPEEHTIYYCHIFSLLLVVVEALVDSLAFMTVLYILEHKCLKII